MAKTKLQPFLNLSVEIESTEPLTKEEEEEVSCGIQTACSWCMPDEPPPALSEIKQAIEKSNPNLAKKLIGRRYF